MRIELTTDIENTFRDLIETLAMFTTQQVDMIPFEGSWTVGQCTEHIIKAMSGMPAICNGPTEPTTRQPDEKIPAIKNVFLDFERKMKSPDFILPEQSTHDLKHMKTELETIKQEMMDIAQTHDLSLVCKTFEVPGFGLFTKFELISFALIHTQRHTHQLKHIRHKLDA